MCQYRAVPIDAVVEKVPVSGSKSSETAVLEVLTCRNPPVTRTLPSPSVTHAPRSCPSAMGWSVGAQVSAPGS